MKMKKTILITGAGGNASIGFCRCLLKYKGFLLIGTDTNTSSINFAVTYKKYLVPSPDSANYLEVINKIIEKDKVDFLHAQPDKEIKILSKNREKIKTKILFPNDNSITIAQDKMLTNQILKDNNIPVPASFLIVSEKDVDKAFQKLESPVWFRATKGAGGQGSLLIKFPKIAKSWIEYWNGYGFFMASKYMPGKNLGWDSVWFKGKLIASHTKERLEYAVASSSPSGISGTSGVIKSVKRFDVEEICRAAVLAIDKHPQGVFSVDLKEDTKGNPYVTEINPARFLSSSTHLFAETGYNLPLIYTNLVFGKKPAKFRYPTGKLLFRHLDAAPLLLNSSYAKILPLKMTDNFLRIK